MNSRPGRTRLRRPAQPAFSPRQMETYRPRVRRTVDTLLDQVEGRTFDVVPALAAPLPIAVITDLMGSRIVAAEGDTIQPAEMVPLCDLLLVAGFETTVNLIGNAVNALLDHPAQWRALCADPPSLAAAAIEETLRWDPPVQRTLRWAQTEVRIEDRRYAPGRPSPPCWGRPAVTRRCSRPRRNMPGLRRAGTLRRRTSSIIRGPIRLPVRDARLVVAQARAHARQQEGLTLDPG